MHRVINREIKVAFRLSSKYYYLSRSDECCKVIKSYEADKTLVHDWNQKNKVNFTSMKKRIIT